VGWLMLGLGEPVGDVGAGPVDVRVREPDGLDAGADEPSLGSGEKDAGAAGELLLDGRGTVGLEASVEAGRIRK
jgi:hypothetical protein